VCAARTSRTRPVLVAAGAFTINFLAADQESVCRALARKDDDKFADIDWEPGPLGHPRIAGAVGYLDCTLHSLLPGGDHVIFTGFVSAAESNDAPPLVFHHGKFASTT
jgi:3-hydroxy-9,10-secoandrosta-1,3,5(10)-triene-9,17-dione monooxygenase reductase component